LKQTGKETLMNLPINNCQSYRVCCLQSFCNFYFILCRFDLWYTFT